MCRVLILDDNRSYAESLQPVVNHFEDNETTTTDIASTLEEALGLAISAVRTGQPYTVFLVDQWLGTGKDGIHAMGELRKVSPTSDAIIFTGDNDIELGIRAYEAGAFRYLAKPIDPKELSFVLNALMRTRREEVENKWRKVFSEMMETALHRSDFSEVARVVVDHSVQLGFSRVHLLWAPRQVSSGQRNTFFGIACAGTGCNSCFATLHFDLQTKPTFSGILRSRNAIPVHEHGAEYDALRSEIEAIGLQMPQGEWWILPLGSEHELLGVLLLDFGDTPVHLSTHERTLLDFFARQASITLEHASMYIGEKKRSDEMRLLQRASVEMLRIAGLNEEWFWITVLTTITASFGLGFNRALVFLTNDNQRTLWGRAAIGRNETEQARHDWEVDVERKYGFEDFLVDVTTGRVPLTPLHSFICDRKIAVAEFGERVRDLLAKGGLIELSAKEALDEFPVSLRSGFDPADCALLSLQAGNNILGLVLVDNKHNQKPLGKNNALEHLKTFLANVSLVWETKSQRDRSEALLEANYEILGGAGHQTLQQTLNIICKTARRFNQADWSIIYPVLKSKEVPYYEFEFEQFGCHGQLMSPQEILQEQPGVGGVTMYILHKGELVVRDMEKEASVLNDVKLYESNFIQSSGVKAMIGLAIKDPDTLESLGIFYLDYLQPHSFDATEILHAKSFARLAAVAISNYRRLDERRHRRQIQTALEISETVGTQLNIEDIMDNVLAKLETLFQNTALCVLLYDEDKRVLEFAPRTLKYYRIVNPEYQNLRSFSVFGVETRSIACKVARSALLTHKQEHHHAQDVRSEPDYLPLNPRTVSELCVSLMDGSGDLLGVLALEREQTAFEEEDVFLVEAVAHQLAQAIERSRSSERLAFKETVATMTSWASDIAHDINSEVGQIRGNAYLIKLKSKGDEIVKYADQIDESAKSLTSVGPWSTQAKREILLDESLREFLKPLISQRNVELELDLCAPDVYIKVNPTEFQHVLRHLVRNSVRAMETFDAAKEKRIRVESRSLSDGRVEILFCDNGPGVDDDVRAAIFQRKATTKPVSDTNTVSGGYGLLISRQLVDDMNGKITLLPMEPGQGAVFSIKLPVVSPPYDVE